MAGIINSGDLNILPLKDSYKIRTILSPFIQPVFIRIGQTPFKFRTKKSQLSLIVMIIMDGTILDKSKDVIDSYNRINKEEKYN